MTTKNEDRAKEDKRYASRLLEYSKSGGTFSDDNGNRVSASACVRQIENTPLNNTEKQFFNLDDDIREEYMNRVLDRIIELMDNGVTEYALPTIVSHIRYMTDTTNSDTFKCNDHWTPCVSRIFNENLEGLFILHIRGVKNEKLPKRSSQEEPMIAPYFLKAV